MTGRGDASGLFIVRLRVALRLFPLRPPGKEKAPLAGLFFV